MKISDWNRAWLAPYLWDVVVELNEGLCQLKSVFHGPTSDGYDAAKELWEDNFRKEMTLLDASALLCKMHRLALFCFFNGNTFVTIIRKAIADVLPRLPGGEQIALRSTIGHYVAGTIGIEDLQRVIESLPEIEG